MPGWDDRTAEWYAREYGDYPTGRLAVGNVELAADQTVLDIGCGTGAALRHASEQVTSGLLIGVDPTPRMVAIAREQTAGHPAEARIRFEEGSAESLPIERDSVDVALALDSIDHWETLELGLAEVHRVLRPAGCFVITKDCGVPADTPPDALERYLQAAGFTVGKETQIAAEGVELTMWICRPAAGRMPHPD